ncbi:hypothetical protein AB0D12_35490 [Streptomyces sp. NPDC048479]|uniref:hypothetical protein n=1 Tax=Streptomyces sp. NPDC048479 TaxID=3154725 RepID=UPI00344068C6
MHTLLPVSFALGAALSNAVATVLQRRAALSVPRSGGFRAGLMLDLLRRPCRAASLPDSARRTRCGLVRVLPPLPCRLAVGRHHGVDENQLVHRHPFADQRRGEPGE